MFFVYILKSINFNWFYVGMTKNINKRLSQHNNKYVHSTSKFSPFKLIYKKNFENRIDARDFEKFLKIHSNKEKILRELKYL